MGFLCEISTSHFGIRAAGVDQCWQAEVGEQNHLAFFAIDEVRVDMTLERPGDHVFFFRPAPVGKCVTEEFQFLTWRIEACLGLSIHHQAKHYTGGVSNTIMLIGGQASFRRGEESFCRRGNNSLS